MIGGIQIVRRTIRGGCEVSREGDRKILHAKEG